VRGKWISFIRQHLDDDDWIPGDFPVALCSLHFKESDFFRSPCKNLLKVDSRPSIMQQVKIKLLPFFRIVLIVNIFQAPPCEESDSNSCEEIVRVVKYSSLILITAVVNCRPLSRKT
jgi:hypothetical protein